MLGIWSMPEKIMEKIFMGLGMTFCITGFCKNLISSHIRAISNPPPDSVIERLKLERESQNVGAGYGMIGGVVSGVLLGAGPALFTESGAKKIILFSVFFCCLVGGALGGIYSYDFFNQKEMINH